MPGLVCKVPASLRTYSPPHLAQMAWKETHTGFCPEIQLLRPLCLRVPFLEPRPLSTAHPSCCVPKMSSGHGAQQDWAGWVCRQP